MLIHRQNEMAASNVPNIPTYNLYTSDGSSAFAGAFAVSRVSSAGVVNSPWQSLNVIGFATCGVAQDSSNNTYVLTFGNGGLGCGIQKYTSAGSLNTTWAVFSNFAPLSLGTTTTTAYLGNCAGSIVIDSTGNLFVYGTNTAGSTYSITKITSAGVITYNWATGMPAGGALVGIDSANNIYLTTTTVLTKISSAGVVTTPFVTYAKTASVGKTALDSGDNIYVLNTDKSITKITSAGVKTDNWGTTTLGVGSIFTISVDNSGNLYGISTVNIFKITSAGGAANDTWAVTGGGTLASNLVFDSTGNLYYLYFTTSLNLRKMTTAAVGSNVVVGAVSGTNPNLLVRDPTTQAYSTTQTNAAVTTYYSTYIAPTPTTTSNQTISGPTITPQAICCDSTGNIYTANKDSSTVSRVTSGGSVTQLWATLASNAAPVAICRDAANNIFTANGNGTVSKITSAAVVTQSWASLGGATPTGIVCDSSGNVYTSNTNGTVSKITAAGAVTAAWATIAANVANCICIDSSNNIYVGMTNANIALITSGGAVTAAWATAPASVRTICVNTLGNVYCATSSRVICKITSAAVLSNLATVTTGTMEGIVADNSDNVYVVNGNNYISRVLSNGTFTQTWTSLSAQALPTGIARYP